MQVDGQVATGFESVGDTFQEIVGAQPGTGAALAVWHRGRWVVDVWGGYRDARRREPWERDSIVMPYSVTKPFAAVCALLLVDRGSLELDAPVNRYWPEFQSPVEVRHVLSHQAGIVILDEPADTNLFYDWAAMCARLAKQKPSWVPGSAIGESALFYGHLVGELVRRVDGRSLGAFLRDEVCMPLGIDFAIGLDARQRARAVELTELDAVRADTDGRPLLYEQAMGNPPGAWNAEVVNGDAFRAAEMPAINGHGTARGVAGLYAALLGGQLLSAGLLAEATRAQATGIDLVVGGPERSWGLGFAVDDDGFGMGGTGGSVGWASVVGDYAFGFVTGSMGNHDRADRLENAVRSCLGLAPI
ncbi:MAG TPA: serine hydrolase domain-containing protein [Candidatus Limnocylindrales bacterium]|nr:serine hydrolase domain-containing protein [Candidatus Limnocylindrales bacterium]